MPTKVKVNARNYATGPRNAMWKGGKSIASNGYVLIRVGINHHLADVRGYAYEHRLNAEVKLGRKLKKHEIVHHIDGNRQNNTSENLEIHKSIAIHRFHHRRKERGLRRPGDPNPIVGCLCGCGNVFKKFDDSNRPRKYTSGHNLIR